MFVKSNTKRFALFLVALTLAVGILLSACAAETPPPAPAPMPPADEPKAEEPKPPAPEPPAEEPKKEEVKLTMSTPAFNEGEPVPDKYTCEGENISPPLNWTEPPSGTQSFVLIVDDPDAPGGVFTHWIVINIPADVRELPEAGYRDLPGDALHGNNDFSRTSYGGPCPPIGPAHRYQFTIYALDTTLDLPPGASKKRILGEMEGHILDQFQIMGTYKR